MAEGEVDISKAKAEVQAESKVSELEAKLKEYEAREAERKAAEEAARQKTIEEQLSAKDEAIKALEEKFDSQLKAISTRQSVDANAEYGVEGDRDAAMQKLKANPEKAMAYHINSLLSPEFQKNLKNPLD